MTSLTTRRTEPATSSLTTRRVEIDLEPVMGAVYYGEAEPEGEVVVIGGREIVVGGWGAYEATRREAHWRANPDAPTAEPRARYGNRTYISAQDAVESLLSARDTVGGGGGALGSAAERLATSLEHFNTAIARKGSSAWASLSISPNAAIVVSTITPSDVRAAGTVTDPAQLRRTAEDVGALASGYAQKHELAILVPTRLEALPPLPTRSVPLRGKNTSEVNRAVTDLEQSAVPRVSAIEKFRANVAVVFDTAASVLERVVERISK